jgi:hypothetical protein
MHDRWCRERTSSGCTTCSGEVRHCGGFVSRHNESGDVYLKGSTMGAWRREISVTSVSGGGSYVDPARTRASMGAASDRPHEERWSCF